jgi:hypothetical protein
MRGSPLLRASLALLALLSLLLPLQSLTNHRVEQTMFAAVPSATAARVHLTITSTTVPFRFEISHLGKVIWEGESTETNAAKDVSLLFPPEGIDLLVDASWTQKKETAVRVEVTHDDGTPIARTLWGAEHVNDVLTFAPPR